MIICPSGTVRPNRFGCQACHHDEVAIETTGHALVEFDGPAFHVCEVPCEVGAAGEVGAAPLDRGGPVRSTVRSCEAAGWGGMCGVGVGICDRRAVVNGCRAH